ncbi:MAG: hypothetical protein O2894_11345 [Planctomycetota bacterium]|nr:hypothetical protein [Planctomycetota bacterium]
MSSAGQDLDLELRRLVVGTNDQRRRVGQTLFHFYRTLIFWREHGMGFVQVTQMWSAGGAAVFDALAAGLRELGLPEEDPRLRAFVTTFLRQLAGDLERGDHMLVSFLRWLETIFPELTSMMQEESADSRIYDIELADILAALFVHCARASPRELPAVLRETAERLGPDAV